jgi:Icc-related predicted phosphoesterase
MKVAITSDTHGYLPEIDPCELVLICGDVSPLEIQRSSIRMEVWIRSKFVPWINNLKCKQVVMVAGNHDIFFENTFQIKDLLYALTKGKLELLENNDCNIIAEDGGVFKIWGSPWCKIFGNWAYMASPEKLKEYYSTMPKNCDIVITHDAPKIGDLGVISEGYNKGEDASNKILADIIKEKNPIYCFCGHIHSGDHKLKQYKKFKTVGANVSYVDENYLPNNKILYIEI